MTEAIDLSGVNPTLSVFPTRKQVIIGCQMVEHSADGPRLSEKTIRLGMTAEDAMRLLALLLAAQKQLGISELDIQTTSIDVPPAKDRH